MGFDIECIIDIHTYPGEYFCPVCRTLVFPNETVQAQCTHLYCKPCLSHVANGSRACPYDGYLVTESDSKPLVDSDKVLAENIGKVKVHCLFFRSGCTWQGTLSECNSHCSACSFGNSAVICNRCGVQIVHRQVHDHAQTCAGGYEAQQAAGGSVNATGLSTASTATAEMNPTVTQPAGPLHQAQNTQKVPVTTTHGQNNPQVNASSQPALVVPGAMATPEQWYQQQYQQYYQQYPGYQLYQQPTQQYYPPQQQPHQQYQQQPVPVQVQNQSNVHSQAAPQIQSHPQPHNQTHLVPQTPQQPYSQPQAQGQAQTQAQGQAHMQAQGQGQPPLQPQMPLQSQPQVQVPLQGVHASIQASYPNYPVNHQLPHPPMRPQAQIPPQTVPPPSHGHVAPYPQAMGMQPAAQHAQVPQYQQPQAHIQPQMHTQPLNQPPPRPQPSNPPLVQVQQQAQSYNPQSQPYIRPPPQPANVPAPLPQVPHPQVPPVSGHHSYQQPQPTQQMQAGLPHQHSAHPNASRGSLNTVSVHGQVPQQPLTMHQPHSSLPQQQVSTMVPMQSQVPPAQNRQFPAHVQQPPLPFQHRPALQPTQQTVPQQYSQQQPFHAPFQSQSHEQVRFPQQPMRPYRPYQIPQFQQPQNYLGSPMTPNLGMYQQTIPKSAGDTGLAPHSGPVQLGSNQTSIDQNNAESTRLERNTVEQAPRSPSNGSVEKGFELVSVKKEVTVGEYETVESGGSAANGGLLSIKQEEVGLDTSLEQTSDVKSSAVGKQDEKIHKEENNLLKNSDSMRQEDLGYQDTNLSKLVAGGVSSTHSDKQSHIVASGSSTEANGLGPKSHASTPQRPQAQFPARSPSMPGPQGPGSGEPGYFVPPPNNFESHSANQGPRFMVANGGTAPESSMFGLRDEKRETFGMEHLDPLPSHRPLVVPHSRIGNFGPGPEFGPRHMKHFGPRSADREYLGISPRGFDGSSNFPRGNSFADNGREPHGFGEGSRSSNPSSDLGNPFHNGRFPSSFGDHVAPHLLNNHNRRDDVFGQEGPDYLTRGDFGRGSFHGSRNSYSIPHAANFAGGGDSFDLSRKRRPISTGWCRICRIDCETVEGLDRHSQTREHQNMAMNMVKTIKQQNKMKQRATAGHISHGSGKVRKVGIEYIGNKP